MSIGWHDYERISGEMRARREIEACAERHGVSLEFESDDPWAVRADGELHAVIQFTVELRQIRARFVKRRHAAGWP